MSDPDAFDGEIERMFARAPAFDDTEAFADRVDRRLGLSWYLRTVVLTGAGVVGGFFAVRETLDAGLGTGLSQFAAMTSQTPQSPAGLDWSQLGTLMSSRGLDLAMIPAMPLFWLVSVAVIGAAVASAVHANQGG